MTAQRILVVEDNPETVHVLRSSLEKAGYSVLTASNGEEGLTTARATPPDLILLDIMMPVMDGFTMNRKLKERPATRQIPVIIVSAREKMEALFDGDPSNRIDGYLVKPFRADVLLDKMAQILGGR